MPAGLREHGSLSMKPTPAHGKLRGFTILEVLIALGVLSVGLAGLAAMQLNSLQYVHSAHYRSLASTIALDLEERVWLYLADETMGGCADVATAMGTAEEAAVTDWSRAAVGDVWEWSTADMLRIPNLSVTFGSTSTVGATTSLPVTLSWAEGRFTENESSTEQYNYTMRVFCKNIGNYSEDEEEST